MAYVSQYTGTQIDTILGGKFSAGTVSAPGINLSDTGTGLYKSATNELGIAVNGAQKVNVNSSGVQVTGGLTVNGVMEVKNAFIFTIGADATLSTYDAYNLILKGANAAGTNGKGILIQAYCTTVGGWRDALAVYNTSGSSPTLQLVPYTGNVIIGTNTLNGSNAILQVACPISIYNADQANARMIINNTAGQSFHLVAGVNSFSQNGFSIYDATHAATRLTIASGGNVSIGSAIDNGVGAFQVDGNVTFSQNAYFCGNTSGLDSTRRDMSSYSYKGAIIGDNSATYPSLAIGGSLRATSGLISFHNFNNANNLATTAGVMIQAYGDDATVTNNGMHLAIATRLSGGALTERMRITSAGNVIIGATFDFGSGEKLQVAGNITIGTLTFGTNASPLSRKVKWVNYLGSEAGSINVFDYSGDSNKTMMAFSVKDNSNVLNERMRITDTGNVLIGSSTDNAYGLLQINGTANAVSFNSKSITTIALTATVTATLFTISAQGMYHVYAYAYGSGGVSTYTTCATILCDGVAARIVNAVNGGSTSLVISLSGLVVKLTSDATSTFTYTYTKFA